MTSDSRKITYGAEYCHYVWTHTECRTTAECRSHIAV